MEKTRTTFYGKKILYSSLSHQHLSNIVWFNRIVWNKADIFGKTPNESPSEWAHINKRFGGILLPYKPLISSKGEIETLDRMGFLKKVNKTDFDIIVYNKWIGEIKYL